jgi:hypothetical protein
MSKEYQLQRKMKVNNNLSVDIEMSYLNTLGGHAA